MSKLMTPNSQWGEQDISPQAKAILEKIFTKQPVFSENGIDCFTTDKVTVEGECTISRKGVQAMCFTEMKATVGWKLRGKLYKPAMKPVAPKEVKDKKEGEGEEKKEEGPQQVEYTIVPYLTVLQGTLSIPKINEDDIGAPEIQVVMEKAPPEGEQQLLVVLEQVALPQVKIMLRRFWSELRGKLDGMGLNGRHLVSHPSIDTFEKQDRQSKNIIRWILANMETQVATEVSPSYRAVLQGLGSTALCIGCSCMVTGPGGLAVASGLMAGGVQGFRSFKDSKSWHRAFSDAFAGSDHLLLEKMAWAFMETEGAKDGALIDPHSDVEKDAFSNWLAAHKKPLIEFFFKSLEDDEESRVNAAKTELRNLIQQQKAAQAAQGTTGLAPKYSFGITSATDKFRSCCLPKRNTAKAG